MAAEGHYRSLRASVPAATATAASPERVSRADRPRIRSVITVPPKAANTTVSKDNKAPRATSTPKKGWLNEYTIPKRKSCVPDRPVYSGKSSMSEFDKVEREIARLEKQVKRLAKPKGPAKTETKSEGEAKSPAKAEILQDPAWEEYVQLQRKE